MRLRLALLATSFLFATITLAKPIPQLNGTGLPPEDPIEDSARSLDYSDYSKQMFFEMMYKPGSVSVNHGSKGEYHSVKSLAMHILFSVVDKWTGEACYFGIYRGYWETNSKKTFFYCIQDSGDHGGSSGVGNLKPQFAGYINLIGSINNFPEDIFAYYID